MSESDYEALSPMEKRDALLHAAVVESPVEGMAEYDSEPTVRRLAEWPEIEKLEDGLTIECSVPVTGEVFVVVAKAEMLGDAATFEVRGPSGRNSAWVNDKSTNYAYPQQGVIVPMGEVEAGETEFVFYMEDGFSCEGVEVWIRPTEVYTVRAWNMKECSLSDVEVGTNYVSGLIDVDDAKWLQLSIPYSDGWTAKVNGEPVELVRSGGMYMGLALERGSHEIELEYRTPYLREGLLISLAALLVWSALAAMCARRRRK